MTDKQQAFQIIFDGGIKTFAAVDRRDDGTSVHCELTHMNPHANLSYMTETGERVSCSVISDANVVRVAKEPTNADTPLTLRVTLSRALKNDCSPLPQKGEVLTLLPENGKNAIRTTCVETNEATGTFAVTYPFHHIYQGAEAWLVDQNGNRSRISIKNVDVHCYNSGINQSICVLHVSEADEVNPLSGTIDNSDREDDKRNDTQTEQTKEQPGDHAPDSDPSDRNDTVNYSNINIPPNPAPKNLGDMQQSGGNDSDSGEKDSDSIMDGNKAIKPPLLSLSARGKSVMQLLIACLATAVFVLILVPAGAKQTVLHTGLVTTQVQSSVATSESRTPPTVLSSLMVWGQSEHETIAMNSANLHKFFGQSDPSRLAGSLTGEVMPGTLGIYCKKTPSYNVNDRTTDASICEIAMPHDAKPGVFKLTPANSATWFHQTDPSCFRETLTPYHTDDTANALHVNLDSCDWSFDPVRKCFDYSECTFTVPRF